VSAFLSAEWLAALNDTLGAAGPPPLDGAESTVRFVFEFTDGPTSTPHALSFSVSAAGAVAEIGDHLAADAVIRLSYRDAEALADGTLDSADALREGRLKVRGDIHGLVPLLAWLLQAHPG
jgi:putative sterol carrier protein